MRFNSFEYIFLFLPIAVIGFRLLHRPGAALGLIWLTGVSLASYAWASPRSMPVLLVSIGFNFAMARALGRVRGDASAAQRRRRMLLFIAIGANALALGYYKYFDRLPLGMSFFTIMQIMYLVDVYERLITPSTLLEHAATTTFFPTVTMGPLLRVGPFRNQLTVPAAAEPRDLVIARACVLFALGLFKKVVLADGCARFADAGFASPAALSMLESWTSSLSYALQLYFDFSGYSDMALASALLLGLEIPVNFNSPYQSRSLIEFWRRWHISLSNFITTYLYTPIVRSFHRPTFGNAMFATLAAMVIAGVWHGSTWNFVVWGALHGVGLVINHVWKKTKRKLPGPVGWLLTILYVNVALVFFRAATLADAGRMLEAMVTFHDAGSLQTLRNSLTPFNTVTSAVVIVVSAGIIFLPWNSITLMKEFRPSVRGLAWTVAASLLALLFLNSMTAKEFLYIDF
jgi:alginate O-acetyltransferase complex protein AlgI